MKRLLAILIVLILLPMFCGCGLLNMTQPTEQTVYAPDLTFQTADGKTVKLSEHFGKPIVLNFWASWNSANKSELPLFQEKYEELGEEVVFMVVCVADGTTETVESGQAYIDKMGYTFPVYFDTKDQASSVYGVNVIPTSFFIAPDRAVLGYATGALTEESFTEGIQRILPSATE